MTVLQPTGEKHARIGTFQVLPEKLQEVESLFQNQVVPAFSRHKGFLGYTAYVDRDRGAIRGNFALGNTPGPGSKRRDGP